MKKRVFTLLNILIVGLSFIPAAIAQKLPPNAFGRTISFPLAVSDSSRSLGVTTSNLEIKDTELESVFSTPSLSNIKTPIMLGVKLNPALIDYTLSPVRSYSKTYTAYRISDRSDALLIALGINKNNVDDYRYRIVLNDSVEVVHWSKIPRLEQKYGAKKPYGFIGNFNYPDKQMLVEVVNVKNYQLRDGIIFDWRKIKPVTTIIRFQPPVPTAKKGKPIGFDWMNIQAPHEIKYDTVTGAPTDIRFLADSVSNIVMYFKNHDAVAYDVFLYKIENGKKVFFTGAEGDQLGTEFRFNFINYPTGDYEIIIGPRGSEGVNMQDQQLHIPLKILPNPVLEKKASLKELLPYMVAALLILGSLFWAYRRRANIKLARSVQARQTVNLKLRSIRAQLNPHFMFNALTSIQNLVNKNDMEGANHYLSRFADLTRKVLNTGERDLISLDDEIRILDDYLQMEQLRFNFKYDIKVGDNLNSANTEVPAMLLQPFLENAVKHGVANLREKGTVNVLISKESGNLLFTITDNGPGFKQKTSEAVNGSFGLKLSEERIALLNQVYKDQPAALNIQTARTGTTITITLTNWIS